MSELNRYTHVPPIPSPTPSEAASISSTEEQEKVRWARRIKRLATCENYEDEVCMNEDGHTQIYLAF